MNFIKDIKELVKRRIGAYLLIGLILILMIGCSKNLSGSKIKGVVKASEDYEVIDVNLSDMNEVISSSIKASNQMGLELIQEMMKQNDKNVLISPISLAFALAMVQNGAEGETKTGILTALGEEEVGLNERYHLLMNYLSGLDQGKDKEIPGLTINIANSLWIREELNPEEEFVNILSRYYNAQMYKADFDNIKTVDLINLWVEEQTNHMLKETIDEINPEVVSYLMNTVYFKGTWRDKFYENGTTIDDFYQDDGQSIKTDMMHKTDSLPYYEDDLCQITSLAYYGGSSMVLVLPKDNIEDLLKDLDYESLATQITTDHLEYQRLQLSLPKFDYQVNNDLNGLLQSRGMEKAFSPEEAELGKMINIEGENVYISRIFQNARIIVDEKGTEAAAVTVIEKSGSSAMPEEPITFECNKPFLYMIKDDQTGAALFIGIVREP